MVGAEKSCILYCSKRYDGCTQRSVQSPPAPSPTAYILQLVWRTLLSGKVGSSPPQPPQEGAMNTNKGYESCRDVRGGGKTG